MKTIAEVSSETLKLQSFIESQPHGAILTYQKIATETGVAMNEKGKQFLRVALKRAKREYTCSKGVGIQLASAEIALPILSTKLTKINNSVKRGDKSQKMLQEQFFSSLSSNDQKRILWLGAVFGAIRVAAKQGEQLYKKNSGLDTIQISLPKLA